MKPPKFLYAVVDKWPNCSCGIHEVLANLEEAKLLTGKDPESGRVYTVKVYKEVEEK